MYHRVVDGEMLLQLLQLMLYCYTQIMKTDFVPKFVAGISACCAVYSAVTVADRLLTVKTLASVGYFDALVDLRPLILRHRL